MRRSISRRKGKIAIALGIVFLVLRVLPAQAGPQVVSGSVNQAPFSPQGAGFSLVDPASPTAKMPGPWKGRPDRERPFPPSTSLPPQDAVSPGTPLPQGAGSPGAPEAASGTSQGSLGNLFELQRQEALLKREISIRKLKDQLKGPRAKKVLDTGAKGSPMTLLAAGFEGKRYAVLEWNDGRRIRVRQGETLPDGARVVRIDGSGVSVRKRGSVVTYPYGESPETTNRGGGGYPPFPPQGSGSPGTPLSGFMPPPPPSTVGGGHP